MLNNKGQSLVLFILIIPMLIGIAAIVIDVGNAYNQKNEMNNAIELVLEYGLTSKQPSETQETIQEELTSPKEENITEELQNNEEEQDKEENTITIDQQELKKLLDYNLKNNQNEIEVKGNKIIITSKTYQEGIFTNILNINGFPIESKYQGYIENGKPIIQKVK